MVRIAARRKAEQRGQAVVLVILSLTIFLFGAMGLGVDGAQLYAQRQMAQAAADAAAQAGIVTIFNGSTAIGTTAFYCASGSTTSPCTYASKNGYTAGTCTSSADAVPGADCIKVDPNPGVAVSNLDPGTPNELQVTITRAVPMTLMKMIGFTNLNVTARATAAILDVMSPVPIIVTHPWAADSFDLNGTGNGGLKCDGTTNSAKITICGGPQRSIQVNSSDPGAVDWNGNPRVDLSQAGPNATGADFGVFGGPVRATGSVILSPVGTTENYLQPADPITDPLVNITPPSQPANAPSPSPLINGVNGCPSAPPKACVLYSPGTYTSSINVTNNVAVFKPGIYYMLGNNTNFTTGANGYMQMATGFTDAATGWTGNMMVYLTGPNHSGGPCTPPVTPAHDTGKIDVGANGSVNLTGSPTGSAYKGILFFVDRAAMTKTHTLNGGGGLTLIGTIYMAETIAMMGRTSTTTCGQFQTLSMQGNPGSTTNITGEIITSKITLGGTPGIRMNLSPLALITVRQIALVNGE